MARSPSSSPGTSPHGARSGVRRRAFRAFVGVHLRLATILVTAVVPGWASGPAPASAQERSVLSLLDTEGRQLLVDEGGRSGVLSADDLVTGSGQRVQAWELASVTGPVQVDLTSQDFDAFLYVLPGGGGALLQDDDSGGDLNSRICLDEPGSYTVIAASLGGGTGPFTLEIASDPEGECVSGLDRGFDAEGDVLEALASVTPEGSLEIPGTETFRFDGTEPRAESRPLKAWTFRGEEGERIALTHRSPGIDTYLYLVGPGLPDLLRDDDSAGDFDARLCVELPESGEFTVYAAPFSSEDVGALHRLETARAADADRACEGSFSSSPAVEVERLLALDVQGRQVTVGSEVVGALGPGQRHPESGEPIQAWRLEGAAGTRVFVDVVSEDFDPTVRVAWPGLDEVLMNDDFGEGCNSRIEFVIPGDGAVSVFPGSWSSSGQGEFLLRVSTNPGPLEEGGCDDDSAGALGARIEVAGVQPGRWVVVVGALGDEVGSGRIRVLGRGGD